MPTPAPTQAKIVQTPVAPAVPAAPVAPLPGQITSMATLQEQVASYAQQLAGLRAQRSILQRQINASSDRNDAGGAGAPQSAARESDCPDGIRFGERSGAADFAPVSTWDAGPPISAEFPTARTRSGSHRGVGVRVHLCRDDADLYRDRAADLAWREAGGRGTDGGSR